VRTICVADAQHDDEMALIVHGGDKLTAFLEFQSPIQAIREWT
jgi:hypothetical protein